MGRKGHVHSHSETGRTYIWAAEPLHLSGLKNVRYHLDQRITSLAQCRGVWYIYGTHFSCHGRFKWLDAIGLNKICLKKKHTRRNRQCGEYSDWEVAERTAKQMSQKKAPFRQEKPNEYEDVNIVLQLKTNRLSLLPLHPPPLSQRQKFISPHTQQRTGTLTRDASSKSTYGTSNAPKMQSMSAKISLPLQHCRASIDSTYPEICSQQKYYERQERMTLWVTFTPFLSPTGCLSSSVLFLSLPPIERPHPYVYVLSPFQFPISIPNWLKEKERTAVPYLHSIDRTRIDSNGQL